MENFGFKGLLVTLYQRVFLSYKTTLIGIGITACVEILAYLVAWPLPPLAHKVVIGISVVFTLLKDKYTAPPALGFAGRKMLIVIVVPLLAVSVGCSFFKSIEKPVLNCATDAIAKQVPELTQDIVVILSGGSPDWAKALDALLAAAGDAGTCAFQVVLAQLETGVHTAPLSADRVLKLRAAGGSVSVEVQLARAEAYWATRGYQK